MSATRRLVVIDLDGTLLRSNGSVSDATREVLATARRSMTVIAATARPSFGAIPVVRELGLDPTVICSNGAEVVDALSGEVRRLAAFDEGDVLALAGRIRDAVPEVTFAVEHPRGWGHERAFPTDRDFGEPEVAALGRLTLSSVTKLVVHSSEHTIDELSTAVHAAVGGRASVDCSGARFVEVQAWSGGGKAGAVRWLAGAHPCAIAFGDMPVDIELLRLARVGVAVANAHADVLAMADVVTRSNDDDGVALVLERAMTHPAWLHSE